jgi:hypothetical protein
MNQLKETLKKILPILTLVALVVIALLVIFFNYNRDTSKNEILDEISAPINIIENKTITNNSKPTEIVVDNLPTRLCAKIIQDEIEEIKKTYLFQINSNEYDTRITKATICSDWDSNCYNRSFSLNEERIQKEIENSKYNLINGCLYKDGLRVFDFDLSVYYKTDFFGLNLESKFGESLTPGTTQSTFEWFRFEDNNKLFIFLKNMAGCGGCAFVGHYLEIDLETEEIVGKYQDGLDNYFNTILSPNKKRAITVYWDKGSYKTELYLYDFTNFSKKLITTISEDKAILYVGHGVQPEQGAISWLDDNTIALQLFEKNIDGINGEIGGVKYIINQEGKNEPIKSGVAQKISVD